MTVDPWELNRFVAAQNPVLEAVRRELAVGRKTTHWMWFVFPQLRGLGRSAMALRFGISGPAEARAYLAHPLLAPRLDASTAQVLALAGRTPEAIFGPVDAVKFRSSMTMFALADPAAAKFRDALAAFYSGVPDPCTEALWAAAGG
ncbi:MAG: DUF1810 domain-containing protein [Acetobacteraceae bacterium]